MNYYVELQKNTQTTNCVKQIKKFNNFEEANEYFKNALLEIESDDKGFIEFGELRIYYTFFYPNLNKSIRIEKDDLKKSNSFTQDYLILDSARIHFSLKVEKIRIAITKIEF